MSQETQNLLDARDADGRMTHFRDWQGVIQPINYPKGKTYAVCGAVSIIHQPKNRYAVVYGLQIKKDLTEEQAAAEFGHCVLHQSNCEQVCSAA